VFGFDVFHAPGNGDLVNQLPISGFDRFINRLGDPNAPPYTGDDPIIRRRLGLPPLEQNT
jgi:hypothetical protein